MNKLILSLTTALLSTSLLAGCGNTNLKSQSYDNYGRSNMLTDNEAQYKPYASATPTTPTNGKSFSDVQSGYWYTNNIQWAASLGLVSGYPDGTFKPDAKISRAEVVTIIKTLADKGLITNPSPSPTVNSVRIVGSDGVTEVKAPVVGDILTANIVTSTGTIGSYPANSNATYKWHYVGSDAVLGTAATYTVTSDNIGKVIAVDVSVNGYSGTATSDTVGAVVAR